jgi:hypothetical protein
MGREMEWQIAAITGRQNEGGDRFPLSLWTLFGEALHPESNLH